MCATLTGSIEKDITTTAAYQSYSFDFAVNVRQIEAVQYLREMATISWTTPVNQTIGKEHTIYQANVQYRGIPFSFNKKETDLNRFKSYGNYKEGTLMINKKAALTGVTAASAVSYALGLKKAETSASLMENTSLRKLNLSGNDELMPGDVLCKPQTAEDPAGNVLMVSGVEGNALRTISISSQLKTAPNGSKTYWNVDTERNLKDLLQEGYRPLRRVLYYKHIEGKHPSGHQTSGILYPDCMVCRINSCFWRYQAVEEMRKMATIPWRTTKERTFWTITYKPGVIYRGIPYSQNPRESTYASFIKLGKFYKNESENILMMKPSSKLNGNDCSSAVTFALRKTGRLQNRTRIYSTRTLTEDRSVRRLASYGQLKPGDFLLIYDRHVLLVVENDRDNQEVSVIEQTEFKNNTTWRVHKKYTYDDLRENEKGRYIPYSVFDF